MGRCGCVRACVRACVCSCVCACVRACTSETRVCAHTGPPLQPDHLHRGTLHVCFAGVPAPHLCPNVNQILRPSKETGGGKSKEAHRPLPSPLLHADAVEGSSDSRHPAHSVQPALPPDGCQGAVGAAPDCHPHVGAAAAAAAAAAEAAIHACTHASTRTRTRTHTRAHTCSRRWHAASVPAAHPLPSRTHFAHARARAQTPLTCALRPAPACSTPKPTLPPLPHPSPHQR